MTMPVLENAVETLFSKDFHLLQALNAADLDNPEIEKKTKGSFESVARKRLGDISNLPQRPKPSTKDEKELFVSNTTKDYIEHLKKLKVLQHELGSKNALLNAKKLEWKEKAEITCQYTDKQALLFQGLKLLLMLYLWRSSLFISTTLTDKLFQIFSCHSK
ncbi:uncharacterized protein LOC114321188 isoform X3 [Camellia sinensis]|nr:uncharacterized protein LOC114321188 isoform X3 [Camellia sinensis]